MTTATTTHLADGRSTTLLHPHGQIYAYPFIPPRSRLLAERAEAYYDDAGGRKTMLRGLDGLYDSPTPYITAWYQAPLEPHFRRSSRLHLQLMSPRGAEDKLKFLAGSEATMGAFINDVRPEEIAGNYRWPVLQPLRPCSGRNLERPPIGAGLSSSAAIECSVAVAVNELAGAPLTSEELAKVGQRAENDMVGAPPASWTRLRPCWGSKDMPSSSTAGLG